MANRIVLLGGLAAGLGVSLAVFELWLATNVGNPNFPYAFTLVFGASQALLAAELVKASERRRMWLSRGVDPLSKTKAD